MRRCNLQFLAAAMSYQQVSCMKTTAFLLFAVNEKTGQLLQGFLSRR